jgi:glucokinase
MIDHPFVIGTDIGGTHITAALVNLNTKKIVEESRSRLKVNAHGNTEEIIATWAKAIRVALAYCPAGEVRMGMGIPGPFDYENGISLITNQDKYEALYGLSVKKLLAEELKMDTYNICMMNDAGSFLQGEVFGGSVQDFEDCIGITLGTGLGTARYHNGLAEDADLWKMPFKESIAEDYISSRWFVKRYLEVSGNKIENVKALVELYNSDSYVPAIFEEFGRNLADFLTEFILIDNPQVIVMGGNISNASNLFLPTVVSALKAKSINIPIKNAILGEDGAILGAASCWYERFLHYS